MVEKRYTIMEGANEKFPCFIKDNFMESYICTPEIACEMLNDYEHKMEKLVKDRSDYEKDNMNCFIQGIIEPLLWDCVAELVTVESMSQIKLAKKIEDEIIPFIQSFKYYTEEYEELK